MLAYPARIKYSRKDKAYLVSFLDFPSINTFGDSLQDALKQASDALSLSFEVDFERGFMMPTPSRVSGANIYLIALPLHVEIPFLLRQMRGKLSQAEVAKRLNITPQAYQKFENPRKCNITLRKLEDLASVFDRSVHLELLEYKAGKPKTKRACVAPA